MRSAKFHPEALNTISVPTTPIFGSLAQNSLLSFQPCSQNLTAISNSTQPKPSLLPLSAPPTASMENKNGNPLQYSCLENPRDTGAWWAAVYGVTQSQTRLKWLSSRSCCFHLSQWSFQLPKCSSLSLQSHNQPMSLFCQSHLLNWYQLQLSIQNFYDHKCWPQL